MRFTCEPSCSAATADAGRINSDNIVENAVHGYPAHAQNETPGPRAQERDHEKASLLDHYSLNDGGHGRL